MHRSNHIQGKKTGPNPSQPPTNSPRPGIMQRLHTGSPRPGPSSVTRQSLPKGSPHAGTSSGISQGTGRHITPPKGPNPKKHDDKQTPPCAKVIVLCPSTQGATIFCQYPPAVYWQVWKSLLLLLLLIESHFAQKRDFYDLTIAVDSKPAVDYKGGKCSMGKVTTVSIHLQLGKHSKEWKPIQALLDFDTSPG